MFRQFKTLFLQKTLFLVFSTRSLIFWFKKKKIKPETYLQARWLISVTASQCWKWMSIRYKTQSREPLIPARVLHCSHRPTFTRWLPGFCVWFGGCVKVTVGRSAQVLVYVSLWPPPWSSSIHLTLWDISGLTSAACTTVTQQQSSSFTTMTTRLQDEAEDGLRSWNW